MAGLKFRVWFGERAASVEELARIEEIVVTQEMDAYWEAQMRMALCLDAQGHWLHWPGDSATPFSRVRIEIDIGDGAFVPLIDGPLVSIDGSLDSQPGKSTATLLVRDDSAWLDRDEEVEAPFEARTASDIASELFGRFEEIAEIRVDATVATPGATTRRGTVLQFLRELAGLNDRRVYVLPGESPGASIGCFLADPTDAADLPPLLLVGDDRNLANASITQDPDGAERTQVQLLRTDDQGVTQLEADPAELGLMRESPAVPADLSPVRLLDPMANTSEDPEAAAIAQAHARSYVYFLTSEVVPGCFGAVLSPYRKVRLDAGATPYSGDYLITKVVHRITPSIYSQQLEAKTDGVTAVDATAVAESAGGGVDPAVSAGGGIF
jgi:hypothetical protein